MTEFVKNLLEDGHDVRIFTARMSHDPFGGMKSDIEKWCLEHIGKVLPVTAFKDYDMIALYDDRAVSVETNTGRRCQCFERLV